MTLVLGAYPVEPTDHVEQRVFYEALHRSGFYSALEVPFHADGGLPFPEAAPAAWSAVVTAIPGTMQRMVDDRFFGLASTDDESRLRAVAFTATIRDYVERLAHEGRQTLAVQLHSAPRAHGSAMALAASLREIVDWDWSGAHITLEHCDALTDSHAPEKGFLSLEEEIEAVSAVTGVSHVGVGVTINWARSVIEARDPTEAERHISRASAAGALAGVMFSSCSPEATEFGYPWIDAHLPAREVHGAPSSSLLTLARIRNCLSAADQPKYAGLKVGLLPRTLSAEVLAERLDSMACAIAKGLDDVTLHPSSTPFRAVDHDAGQRHVSSQVT